MKTVSGQPQPASHSALDQARVDLAACHRLAVRNGFHEGIDNHITLLVPGQTDRFLLAPFGLHWSEVRARDFLIVTLGGKIESGRGIAEDTAFCIHAPIHKGYPTARCIIHTHMPFATSIAMLEGGILEPASQNAAGFFGAVAYAREYEGLALDPAEGERLALLLKGATTLFLANHGVLVVGQSAAEAFERVYYLERACQLQVLAMSTGRKLNLINPKVLKRTQEHFQASTLVGDRERYDYHFSALKRLLDRDEPDYAELA